MDTARCKSSEKIQLSPTLFFFSSNARGHSQLNWVRTNMPMKIHTRVMMHLGRTMCETDSMKVLKFVVKEICFNWISPLRLLASIRLHFPWSSLRLCLRNSNFYKHHRSSSRGYSNLFSFFIFSSLSNRNLKYHYTIKCGISWTRGSMFSFTRMTRVSVEFERQKASMPCLSNHRRSSTQMSEIHATRWRSGGILMPQDSALQLPWARH